MIGSTLGPYQIIEEIGHGGMGVVYKALQPSINRAVAIKVLPRQLAADTTFVARFKREVQLIARLEHAHILPVYDYGESDGLLYIVMRYLPSGTLKTRLDAGRLPLRDAARILSQLASALDYAHKHGVIHRDIKPANVLIDAQGDVFLTDFGIAKEAEGTFDLTGSSLIGTPQYMSPEQGQGLSLDGRSDVYALGVVLYEMISGRLPYHADSLLGMVMQHINAPLPEVRSHAPDLPQPIEAVLHKALAKQPQDRYTTAGALSTAFDAVLRPDASSSTQHLQRDQPRTQEIDRTRPALPRVFHARRWMPFVYGVLLVTTLIILSILVTNTLSNPTIPTEPPEAFAAIDQSGACEPLLFDDFSDPASGFPRGERDNSAWDYVDGEYQLLIKLPNQFEARTLRQDFGDYAVEVDAHLAEGEHGSYGLVLAADATDTNHYAFAIDDERNFAVTKRSPSGTTIVRDWMFVPSINAAPVPNQLRAVHKGDSLALYANNILLTVVNDAALNQSASRMGLIAASFGAGAADARFDDFRVCRAPASIASSQVTLIDAFDDDRNLWGAVRYPDGSALIEDGQFQLIVPYQNIAYALFQWNPTFNVGDFELEVESRVLDGSDSTKAGVMFGVQDFDNNFILYVSAKGELSLYQRVAGDQLPIFRDRPEASIQTGGALNRWQINVRQSQLTLSLNDVDVLRQSIDYRSGSIGFACEANAAPQAQCSFDNLAVRGAPASGDVNVYPFCNCLYDVHMIQTPRVVWEWQAADAALVSEFLSTAQIAVMVDGMPLETPAQYWGAIEARADGAKSSWIYPLPGLSAGSHVVQVSVHSDVALTDGYDINADGRADTIGPGELYNGHVQIVVTP